MKIFAVNELLDDQQKKILSRIRPLMNGVISQQLLSSGMNYEKAFGTSLIHLRQLAKEYKCDNELAERLWFRNIRETMILATMLTNSEDLSDNKILEWVDHIINVELAEQFAFNLLGRKKDIKCVVKKMMEHPALYVRYTALMSIGWHFRFVGNGLSPIVKDDIAYFDSLVSEKPLIRAVVHCLKMAGRFNPDLTEAVSIHATSWAGSDDILLQRAGLDILEEIAL